MQIEKADWQWFLSIIATLVSPLITMWLNERGLFRRNNCK